MKVKSFVEYVKTEFVTRESGFTKAPSLTKIQEIF